MTRPRFTDEEISQIKALKAEGKTNREIGKILMRPTGSIYNIIYRNYNQDYRKKKQEGIVVPMKTPLSEYTNQEILKYLYDEGFRIEDNQLIRIHITKTPIRIENII